MGRALEAQETLIRVRVHLVDGTYELFRAFYGAPSSLAPDGREVGATRALMRSLASLLRQDGVTHVGIAFDHVIESFRNDLWPGYKTGDGIDRALWTQFHPLEAALMAMGVITWPMVLRTVARTARPVTRAASLPCSGVRSVPTRPWISLPSVLMGPWPET